MDNSISDILASVTRAAYATSTSLLGHTDHPSAPTIPPAQLDLQLLTRAWVSERSAPELLPYPTDLVERVMARIREQVRNPTTAVQEKTGKLSYEKANGRGHGTTVDRVDRRHDSTHGRGHVVRPGRAADGTRAVQVPGAEFPPSAHRKGRSS